MKISIVGVCCLLGLFVLGFLSHSAVTTDEVTLLTRAQAQAPGSRRGMRKSTSSVIPVHETSLHDGDSFPAG